MLKSILVKLTERQDLSRQEAADAMRALMSGESTPATTAAFLIALRMKGETVEEIAGLAETMRAFATRIETHRTPLVDTCGTGGDHAGTFNISTTAAFVTAGAGVAVAKHGNRSATSKCGSADVLEALGVNLDASPAAVAQSIDDIGIGFLFARSLHTAMKHVAPVRQELGVRTVFNILGPLTNPAGACGQVVGVPSVDLVEPLVRVLAELGARHAFVVSGYDGLDELTIAGPTYVAEAKAGSVTTYDLEPERLGLVVARREDILGGDAAENAAILRSILEGAEGPKRDVVLLNAAAAIQAGDKAGSWEEGVVKARDAIDSGAALDKLNALIKASHS